MLIGPSLLEAIRFCRRFDELHVADHVTAAPIRQWT
jgi:hypothetical protein